MSHKKNRQLSHAILTGIFSCFLFVILFFYAIENKIKWLAIATLMVEDLTIFIISPLLLIYVKSLFPHQKGLLRDHKYHFVPTIIYLLGITLPVYYYIFTQEYLFRYVEWFNEYDFLISFQIIYLILYAIFSLWYLNRFESRIKNFYSNLDDKDLSWIRFLLMGIIAVGAIDFSTSMFELMFGMLNWDTGIITILALVILITWLAYNGFTQSQILLPSFVLKPNPKTSSEEPFENRSQRLKEDLLLIDKIINVFENEKLYKDPELTLSKLAMTVDATNKSVSTILNHEMQTSFYDLVNLYRVKEVKRMIDSKDYENYSLIGIGYEAGFTSKTSFYRVFKKQTGLTPAQYKSE